MTPDLRTVGPKGAEIGTYTTTFVYQGPFQKDSSTGFRVVNEVVLEGRRSRKFRIAPVQHPRAYRIQTGFFRVLSRYRPNVLCLWLQRTGANARRFPEAHNTLWE